MSKVVDERVVSMQFDNRNFENNVKTTMSTLDKLKQKLKLDGASKGLQDLEKSTKNFNMAPLSQSVEAVTAKFSAMQVMGITALANLTNSAVNAGKHIVKALTIDPVTTGFQEYETQINATQTILSNTQSKGSTIDDVNKALDELNEYADLTIYNFTEMTKNIGTFTAAGVDLETSVNAIKGIANLAAMSGSTSQQASTAMYQLSQALASGTVKLMDWNSVVNAGMGGQVFQDALKETARASGIAIDEMIEKHGSFRETLKEGWLTSEVLTTTLKNFTLTTEGLTEEQIKANKEMLKAKGYTDDQIDAIFELGKNATNAATKVKTFSQLWDVMKESVQSGWAQTWRLIVGDFEDAKVLFTPLSNFLTGMLGKMSDARNRVVQVALAFTEPWQIIKDKLSAAGVGLDKIKQLTDGFGDFADKLQYYQDVVTKVWRGDYSNWFDTPDRRDLLAADGYDYRIVQDLVNKGYQYKLTVEDIEASYKKFGVTAENASKTAIKNNEKFSTATADASNKVDEMSDIFANLSDEQLKSAGLTEEEIRLFRALEKEAKATDRTMSDLIEAMSGEKTNGRQLLLDSLANIGKSLVDLGGIAKKAWEEIFNPPSNEEIAVKLYTLIESLKKFTDSLNLVDKETGELNENGEKIKRTIKGVFAAFDIITTLVSGPIKIAFKAIAGLLSALNIPILDVTASIGDAIVSFDDWLNSVLDFEAIFTNLINFFKSSPSTISKWWSSFKESKIFIALLPIINEVRSRMTDLFESFKESKVFKTVSEYITPLINKLSELFNGIKEAENIPEYIFSGLVNGIKDGASNLWSAIEGIIINFIEIIKNLLGIHSPSTVMFAIGGFIIAGLVGGLLAGNGDLTSGLQTIVDNISGVLGMVPWDKLFSAAITGGLVTSLLQISSAFKNLTSPLKGAGEVMVGVGSVIQKSAKPISKVITNASKVVKSFSKVLNSFAFAVKAKALKDIAISIGILVAAVALLTYVDQTKLLASVGVIIALSVVLGLLALAVSKMSSSGVEIQKGSVSVKSMTGTMLALGLSLLAIAAVVKLMGGMNPDQMKQGFLGLAGLILAIAGVFAAYGLLVKGKSAQNVDKAGKMLRSMSISLLLLVAVCKLAGMLSVSEMLKGFGFIVVFIGFVAALTGITKLAGKKIDSVGTMILKVSLALLLLVGVVKLVGLLSLEELGKGALFAAGFVLFVAALLSITKVGKDQEFAKLGGLLMSVSFSLLLLAGACKLIGLLTWEDMAKAAAFVTAFVIFISILVSVTKVAKEEQLGKAAGTILAASLAIAIMAVVAIILSFIKIEDLVKGALIVAAFGAIVIGLVAVSKGATDVGKTITGMAIAIGVMAAAIVVLSFIDPKKLVAPVAAMTILMGMFAYILKNSKDVTGSYVTIGILSGVVLLLSGVLFALSTLPADRVIASSAALAIVMLSFSKVLTIISNSKSISKAALKGIATMAAVAAVLGAVILLISQTEPERAIASSVALGVVINAFAASMRIVSKAKSVSKKALTGIAIMAAVAAVLGAVILLISQTEPERAIASSVALGVVINAFAVALSIVANTKTISSKALPGIAMMNLVASVLGSILYVLAGLPVESTIGSTIALSTLLIAFSTSMAIISNASNNGQNALIALGIMSAITVVLAGILAGLSMLPIENSIANATALSTLLIGLSAACLIVSFIPAAGAIQGALGLAGFIAIIAAVLTALGALSSIPGVNELVSSGGQLLASIGYAIGNFVGSIIGGLSAGITSGLPEIGQNLSDFATNVKPFVEMVKMVDASVLEGVATLSGAILALTAASFINGITTLLPVIPSFAELGSQLTQFMTNAMPFIVMASTITPSVYDGIKNLSESILMLTGASLIEGIASFVTGGSSLEKFSTEMSYLGDGLRNFSDSIGTFSDDELATVIAASNAVRTLAEASQAIPNTGGLLSAIVGENGLGTFADQFPILGNGLRNFLTNVGTFSEEEVATVTAAAEAIKTLASASSEIPNSGGWLGQIVGENDLGTFADQFPILGNGLRNFLTNVGTFSDEQVNTVKAAAEAIKTLASASSEIPNSGGLLGQIVGENDLGTFADQFPNVGAGLAGLVEEMGTMTPDQLSLIDTASKAVATLASVSKEIPNSGGWLASIVGDNDLGSFADQFPKVGTGLSNFATNLGDFGNGNLVSINAAIRAIVSISELTNANLDDINSKMTGLSNALPGLATSIVNMVDTLDSVGVTNLDSLIKKINKIKSLFNGVKAIGAESADGFVAAVKKLSETAFDSLVETFTGDDASVDAKEAVKTIATSIQLTAIDFSTSGKTLGKNFGFGLVNGINAKKTDVYNAGYALGKEAVRGEKDGQKSNSPSKATEQNGKWIGEGLIIGINSMATKVYKSGAGMGKLATSSISNAIGKVSDIVSGDIDTQPVIRPVIDLNSAIASANTLNSLFNTDKSIGLLANVGTVNSMMNSRQNGGNSDIVNAINKLNREPAPGNTYVINGITYDDGSNVSDTVNALIRAINIERRR